MINASVVKLVDTPGLGPDAREGVEVRVLSDAPTLGVNMNEIVNDVMSSGIVGFDEYIAYLEQMQDARSDWLQRGFSNYYIIDLDGIHFLKNRVKGFMTSPVAVYDGKAIQAQTIRIEDSDGFQEFLDLAARKDVFLYQLMFHAKRPVYHETDPTTFETTPLNVPRISDKNIWVIRFGLI